MEKYIYTKENIKELRKLVYVLIMFNMIKDEMWWPLNSVVITHRIALKKLKD